MIRRSRAFSLLEVLLTLSLLGLLLFAIGNVLAHVLDSTQLGQNRSGLSQSADELASRLTSEARSSTAVFVPATDIMGVMFTHATVTSTHQQNKQTTALNLCTHALPERRVASSSL